MKKTLLGAAAVLALASGPALAGAMSDPIVDATMIMAPVAEPAGSSAGSLGSSAGGIALPLAALLLLGVAASSSGT